MLGAARWAIVWFIMFIPWNWPHHLSGHPWKLWGEQEREKQGQIWLWRVYQSLPVMAAEKRSLSMQTYTIPFQWQSGTVPDQANCIDLDSDAEGCYNSPAGCGTRKSSSWFWSPLFSLIFPNFPLQRWSNDQICDFEGCPLWCPLRITCDSFPGGEISSVEEASHCWNHKRISTLSISKMLRYSWMLGF